MKTKLSLTLLLSFVFSLLSSQVPQGFNYQAIAKDGNNPIANQTLPVRITIQADSLGTMVIWQELHLSVMTNGSGLFTLILGKGSRQAVSTVATFSDIDWSITPKFIKTEINYGDWTTMGVTRFWSVPYSLNTENVTGTLSKLAVKGKTAINDEALFEVKNKDGQTVFAVYNEGVRVYVSDGAKGLKGGFAVGGFGTDKTVSTPYFIVGKDSVRVYLDTNPLTKKLKGGFAVGGYDLTKGIVQDYLDVNSDSVRIYIDSDPATKKLKGGFAVGGYDIVKGTSTNYINVNPDTTSIIYPSQNKIYWYPLKNAFLTGRVLIEKPDSVGTNSFVSGYESKAKGRYSQALGYKTIARGDYSTAIGKNAIANKVNSFAFGENAQAKSDESYAFGRGAIAEGFRSYAFGSAGVNHSGQKTGVAYAKGIYSFAFGQGSQSLGDGSFTFGLADTATGNFATAIGLGNASKAYGSTALGYLTKASNAYATSMGNNTIASGFASTAIGTQTKATGAYSTAMGVSTTASGTGSFTIGNQTTAIGSYDLAMGQYTTSSGVASVAMGYMTNATGSFSFATGNRTTTTAWCTFATGYGSTASGSNSAAMGDYTKASGFNSIATGSYTISSGLNSFAMGKSILANTCGMVAIGRYNDTTKYNGINSYSDWYDDDPLFVIGNGTSDETRSNALTILKNGMTAIGHHSPSEMFDVNGNARFRGVTSGIALYSLNLTADGTLSTATSDESTKENINQITNAIAQVNKLRGVTFTWKNDSSKTRQMGMIAQEVEPVVPEIVFTNPVDRLKGINYSQATALLVEAIKEQQNQIEFYKSENDNLKSQLQSLQEKVDRIEAMLAKGGEN
jgi:hypothetical protein